MLVQKKHLNVLINEAPHKYIHAFPLDISNEQKTQATISNIETKLGQIDLAILNAGTHESMSVENFSTKKFRLLVETNLMGTVYGLAYLIKLFLARKGGKIVIVSSIAGYRGLPTSSAYGATKAALINMCEALKPELHAHNIYLALVNPGFVKTPLTDKNDFNMPFLISAEEAAIQILKGINRRQFEISFPFFFSLIMKILRIVPDGLYFFLTRQLTHNEQKK